MLPRAWQRAFAGAATDSGSAISIDDAGLADYQRIMGARVAKGSRLLKDPTNVQSCISVAVLTEPMDAFVSSFLDTDVEGRT